MRVWLPGKPRLKLEGEQNLALHEALGEDYRRLTGPVVLRMRFIFAVANPRERVPVTQPALPGLVRGYLTGLCGLAWENEKQIIALYAHKEYGNVSGVDLLW